MATGPLTRRKPWPRPSSPTRPPTTCGKARPEGRWDGIVRPYSPEDVERLRGSVRVEHTLAELGARRLWELLHTEPYVQRARAP